MGKPLPDLLRQYAFSSRTFYRSKSRYDGLEPGQLLRLKRSERENTELKKIGANPALVIRMLKDFNLKNW